MSHSIVVIEIVASSISSTEVGIVVSETGVAVATDVTAADAVAEGARLSK